MAIAPQDSLPARPPAMSRVLVLVVLVVNLFVGGIVALTLQQGFEQARKHARDTTENLAKVLESHILGLVQRIDLTLLAVRDEVERQQATGRVDEAEMSALLTRHSDRLPGTLGLRVTGPDGVVRYAVSGVAVRQASIADRPHFSRLRDDPEVGLVISEPMVGRVSGQPIITLHRRIDGPGRSFAGDVHVSVPLDYFSRSFGELQLGGKGAVSLWNETPTLLVRHPAMAESVGHMLPSSELRALIAARAREGGYSTRAGSDGVLRLFASRRIGDLPLYVSLGFAEDDYLADWRRESLQRAALALLFTLSTVVVAVVVNRGWLQRQRDLSSVIAAKSETEIARRKSELILSSVAEGIYGLDHSGQCTFANAAAVRMVGWGAEEMIGRNQHEIIHHTHADGSPHPVEDCPIYRTIRDGQTREVHNDVFWSKDGSSFPVEFVVSPLTGPDGGGAVIIFRDITQRRQLEDERAMMITRMAEAGRLESLGTLAGGVAHEINTPTQFIGDNLTFIRDWLPRLFEVIDEARRAVSSSSLTDLAERLRTFKYDFAVSELPAAAEQSLAGIGRIAAIVRAIKEFSYPSGRTPQPFDLNRAIEVTVTVTHNRWKCVAELHLDLASDLPHINGIEGEINQVLVNLIVNAAQAIEEKGGEGLGRIDVTTRLDGDEVEISVTDTGGGIAKESLDKLFELFFTTKAPGKGTGQGLAISKAIVNRHGGTIAVRSEPGSGATFTIRLPVGGPANPENELQFNALAGRLN